MTDSRSSCCEVCDRSPTCAVDCGSCAEVDPYVAALIRRLGEDDERREGEALANRGGTG